MNQIPNNDEEWAIHSLNIHGTFFQRRIADIINTVLPNKINYLDSEYPIEYTARGISSESRVDVLGYIPKGIVGNSGVFLTIECKKANPDFVDWIFYPLIEPQIFGSDHIEITLIQNRFLQSTDGIKPDLTLLTKNVVDVPIADDCRETRGDYVNYKNKVSMTKTSNDAIENAAYQVTLATHAIAQKHYEDSRKYLTDNGEPPFVNYIYLPVIVTTANLYRLEFNLKDIDIKAGEIPLEKARLVKVEHLFYKYPIPPRLQILPDEKFINQYDFRRDTRVRRFIYVSNAENFDNNLKWLISFAHSLN